ncbi:amidohydrolase family protein [Sphingomonas sp. BK235]|uniref:amidohydrolase family protein n=1 Tax=Sphingomonas sp. BK235 TaxID=2512131 RepID=UPI0010D967F4|nr:amidohydrolase family protein [Sphingomonas sp. BK235]TCP36584.1 putative TIM-barrel fold metal-dependent hydrolase [Sphingomonas sp. BK235]
MTAAPPSERADAPIRFVDAHVHHWQRGAIVYPWLAPPFDDDGPNGDVAAIAHDYLPRDHRAAVADWGLVATVHVEAGARADQALDETHWLDALAQAGDGPDAIVAFARLDAPDVAARLHAQAALPRVRGVRQILNWHPDPRRRYAAVDLSRDARWQAGFARLADHGLSFDLQCYPAQMPALAALAARHPAITVIVNHLGMPVLDDPDGLGEWRRGLRALAALPHTAIKLSGLGFVARDWTFERVRPLLEEAIALFGTRRCLIASDLPTDALFAPPERYRDAYQRLTAGLSLDEQRDLWGRNADRLYRLGLDLQE